MALIERPRMWTPLIAVLLLAGCAWRVWQVDLRGFGPVEYGMTLSEASRVLGERLVVRPQDEITEGCSYLVPTRMPMGAAFIVVDGRIERVDVGSGSITTREGARIGASEADIVNLYPGQVRVEPHPYEGPEGHYLRIVPKVASDSMFGIIFETDGQRVTRFRAGREPAVSYIEGCL